MSYICMIANQTGIALAGDSRITVQPAGLGLHLSGRKVFSAPGQRRVWGCCGLRYFGGMFFPGAAKRMLDNPHVSLATALRRISDLAAPATRAYRRLYRKNSSFVLLAGEMKEDGPDVRRLVVRNGEVTVERFSLPVVLEGGWSEALYPEPPALERLAGEPVAQLGRIAVQRVQQVIAMDKARHREDARWKQTVGGHVRCVFEGRKE